MAASMSSSFFLISLSVARICGSTLDPFPLASLLSIFADDVRLPIMFSRVVRLSLRCANLVGARAGVEGDDHCGLSVVPPRALVLRVAEVNGLGRGLAHQAGAEGNEPDHQPRDGPFEVHGALVAGSVLLQA